MKFIRLKDVIEKTGIARGTIYKFMANDKFPKTIPLGDRAVAWLDSDIDEWMLERIALQEA